MGWNVPHLLMRVCSACSTRPTHGMGDIGLEGSLRGSHHDALPCRNRKKKWMVVDGAAGVR